MMPGDSLQDAGKIGDCRRRASLPVEKKAQAGFEGFHLDEIGQARQRRRVTAHAHHGRGEGADLPCSVREGRWSDWPERRVLQQIVSGQPIEPDLTVPMKRFGELVPFGNPVPPAIGDRNSDLWPALDRERRPLPRPHR